MVGLCAGSGEGGFEGGGGGDGGSKETKGGEVELVGTVLYVVRVCEIGWSDRYDRFNISSLSPCGDGQLG